MEYLEIKRWGSVLAKYATAPKDRSFLSRAMDFDESLRDLMELAILAVFTKCGIQLFYNV
jgi:hypothetical protein